VPGDRLRRRPGPARSRGGDLRRRVRYLLRRRGHRGQRRQPDGRQRGAVHPARRGSRFPRGGGVLPPRQGRPIGLPARPRPSRAAPTRARGPAAGITVVVNYAGDRAFITYLPPRAQTESREHERWLEILHRERPTWCYLHAHRGMAGLMREARDLGIRVAVDVGLNEIASDPAAVLACARLADVFLPNAEELLRLTGAASLAAAIDTAASWGPPVVVKLGANGAMVAG